MRNLFILLLLILSIIANAQDGIISGTVTSAFGKEPLPFAKIIIYQNDTIIITLQSDFDGKYVILLPKGKYDIVTTFNGLGNFTYKDVILNGKRKPKLNLDIELTSSNDTIYQTTPLIIICSTPLDTLEFVNGVRVSDSNKTIKDTINLIKLELKDTPASKGGGVAGEKGK